jgi:hypothetical protein
MAHDRGVNPMVAGGQAEQALHPNHGPDHHHHRGGRTPQGPDAGIDQMIVVMRCGVVVGHRQDLVENSKVVVRL